MVRASYYIGYVLWPEMCALVSRPSVDGWETWIRLSDGNEGSFRKWQHFLQSMVVVLVPMILSFSAVVISVFAFKNDPSYSIWPVVLYGIVLIFIWIALFLIPALNLRLCRRE